jgi:hypothetical protein
VIIQVIFFYLSSEEYITSYASYDWYSPENVNTYKVLNFSYVHILEVIILAVCAYSHR